MRARRCFVYRKDLTILTKMPNLKGLPLLALYLRNQEHGRKHRDVTVRQFGKFCNLSEI